MSSYLDTSSNNFLSNYKIIKYGSDVLQYTLSSWTDMLGSEIAYTPGGDATFVVYEYSFSMAKYSSNNINNVITKLLHSSDGSSWADYLNNTSISFGSTVGNVRRRGLCNIKLLLNSWGNTEKVLKLQGKRLNSSSAGQFHKLTDFLDSGGSAGDRYFRPIVSCYSITQ